MPNHCAGPGEGSFGAVYKATWHQVPVAVKVLLSTSPDAYGGSQKEAAERALTLSSPVLANLQKGG